MHPAATEIVRRTKSQEKEAPALAAPEDKTAHPHKSLDLRGARDELDWIIIGEGVSGVPLGRASFDTERWVRETNGDHVIQPTIRDDVKAPEPHPASLPVTLHNPKSEAAAASAKIGKATNPYG